MKMGRRERRRRGTTKEKSFALKKDTFNSLRRKKFRRLVKRPPLRKWGGEGGY